MLICPWRLQPARLLVINNEMKSKSPALPEVKSFHCVTPSLVLDAESSHLSRKVICADVFTVHSRVTTSSSKHTQSIQKLKAVASLSEL